MKHRSPKIPLIARSTAVVALTLLFLGSSARAQSNFDWKQASGTKLVVMLNKHPYADAIIKRLQEFKDLTGIDGGFAEYMRYPKEGINHHVPEDLPIEKAILVEPFACSAWCIKRAQIGWDDFVVLAGAGTLGLGMVGAARLRNPKKLVVLDVKPERLKLAKEFGADLVFNPLEDDVVKIVKEMTGGYGCDIYIEATGHPNAVVQGLQMIRKLGRFVEFSVFSHEVTVRFQP